MIKPFVLMTVHRRYFELITNIKRYNKLKSEFQVSPEIVLVWADPIKKDEWIFKNLFDKNYIDHLIYRELLEKPIKSVEFPTAYPESVNIRLGLNYIKSISTGNSYCLMQCHDVFVRAGTYQEIDNHLQLGYEGVLFDWQKYNGCYSTNFFVVNMDENYWPPISDQAGSDFLEHQWWMKLENTNKDKIKIYTDSTSLFLHSHDYEEQLKFLKENKI